MGGLEDTRAQISRELRYQSSLDLDEATYAAIRHLPLAQDLVRASRQQLVHRLDTYSKRHHKIFMEVSYITTQQGFTFSSVHDRLHSIASPVSWEKGPVQRQVLHDRACHHCACHAQYPKCHINVELCEFERRLAMV